MRRRLWYCMSAYTCFAATCVLASADIDTTNKHVWAENVGWTVAVQTNDGMTVHFDGNSGYLSGFAWGENIGWLKMGDNSGGPYSNDSASDWGVNMDGSGTLAGYAWGENIGWVNFNPIHGGVSINITNGLFSGYAWGENIGWLQFKGSTQDYNMRTRAFDSQPLGTPNWWLAHHTVVENYDDGDGVPAWKEYVSDTNPTNPASYFYISSISNPSFAIVTFLSSSRRYYTLQYCEDLINGAWANIQGQVNIQGADGLDSLQDSTNATKRFYRVRVGL
jgi:hypothetical protein